MDCVGGERRLGQWFHLRYHVRMDELERLAQRRRSVRPAELHRILTRAGFVVREGRGSHRVYRHPGMVRILTIPQNQNPVRAVYVDEAIKAIREVRE